MTRSRRHTPKLALGGDASEKQDRARAHRKERHAVKTRLTQSLDADGAKIEHKRSGTWNFAKDGKHWVEAPEDRRMRK
jgi:hypothetical protein